MPTWLPTESEAPSINPRCVRFFFAFPRRFAFSLAIPMPGDSRLAVLAAAGRGLVVLQLNDTSKVGSWLLLVPPHRLVFFAESCVSTLALVW